MDVSEGVSRMPLTALREANSTHEQTTYILREVKPAAHVSQQSAHKLTVLFTQPSRDSAGATLSGSGGPALWLVCQACCHEHTL